MIGRSAKEPHFQGGGSSHINPTRVDSPFDELQKLAGDAQLTYSEGYPAGLETDQALIDAAVQAAKAADVALLYIALPGSIESEGYDRDNLDLTEQQVALIKAVCAAQPHSVVILNSGSAVVMNEWIDGAAAVLQAWMMGQAGGGAIAGVLFGAVNPSGKLTETFPLRLVDTPSHLSFPGGHGEVRYGEDIFIGYRYYDAREVPVLFPFGHGLSYTQFAYSNLRASATTFKDADGLTVSVDVTNTGAVAGQEIVQIYVHDHAAELVRPPKEVKGSPGRSTAGRDEDRPDRAGLSRLRLLSPRLSPLDHRGRRLRHPGRGLRRGHPRQDHGHAPVHAGTAQPAQPRVHPG